MIGWKEIYNVVVAMVPLYVPVIFGYGSVKWWHMFKAEQCNTINRLSCYFILPYFTFDFVAHVNPYQMNYRFLAADVISKCIIAAVLVLWANLSPRGSFPWCITIFSLSTLNSTLVMGVPLLKAMYHQMGADLVVQSFLLQAVLWSPALLFMYEFWHRKTNVIVSSSDVANEDLQVNNSSVDDINSRDLEENTSGVTHVAVAQTMSFWSLMKIVPVKVVKNPNCFSCIIAIIWTLLANRWHFEMPRIVEGSVLVMSKAGTGVAMFNIGLFMALQHKMIACGSAMALLGMVLRFIVGPAALAIGSLIVGLRGDALNITIIQAALPQAIAAFVFAKEYGLHADVISTAVIFGTIVSLPVLIAFYALMEMLN